MPKHAFAIVVALLGAAPGFAQIVSYEGNSFPEEEGWERRLRPHPPDRWLEDGWLHFRCEVFEPKLCAGEDEFYRWELDEFAGAQRFMFEWRVITDGPRSEILDVAPTGCVASGQSGISFHTTVASDQVRFFVDIHDAHWIDVEPDVGHGFRVDIYGEFWYEWSIDGEVRVAGRPPKQYPTTDSFIIWGARAACFDNLSAFDFVRFGVPEDEPEIDCDAVRKLKAWCREGRGEESKIVATVRTRLDEGTELTLTNNGDHRTMRAKPNGKAMAKFKCQSGQHTLLLLDCPQVSQIVECE